MNNMKIAKELVKLAYELTNDDLYALTENISDAYETLKELNMANKKIMSNETSEKFDKALEALEDVMSSISLQ